jgi:hypothetical protein
MPRWPQALQLCTSSFFSIHSKVSVDS